MDKLKEKLYTSVGFDLEMWLDSYLKEYQELTDVEIMEVLETTFNEFRLNNYWRE